MILPEGKPKLSRGMKLCRTAFKSIWKVPAVGFSRQIQQCGGHGLWLLLQSVVISRIFLETLGPKGLKAENLERSHTAKGFLSVSVVNMPAWVSDSSRVTTGGSLIFPLLMMRNWCCTTGPLKILGTLKSSSAHVEAGIIFNASLIYPSPFCNVSCL